MRFMDDTIKSAREIALEKVEKLGQATQEERLGWKNFLLGELGQYQGDAKKYVAHSASEVLIRNIGLPKSEAAKKKNKKMMDGLKLLKDDKVGVENVYSRFRDLFAHYGG